MKKTATGTPPPPPAASPRGRGSSTRPSAPQQPGPSSGLFGSEFSSPRGAVGGVADDAMSIASSHGSQGWEDEPVEESVKAAEKREVAYHVQRLEELGFTAGPRAKASLVPKKRKGRARNNSIWPTHVAYPWAPAELGLPLREHVVGPFPRTCRPELYPRHIMWGATTNLRLATEPPIYGPGSIHQPEDAPSTSKASSDVDHQEKEKLRHRIREFKSSLGSPVTSTWPEVALPQVTSPISAARVAKVPIPWMTPVPSHYELQPGWKRCSYLMEPIDFQLRNFMIHFILSPQQHATVHYNSGLYLIDKAAIAGLTYECDSYRQVNRAVGDQTMTPTFVTHCPGGTWENVPLSKIRTRPVKILFDWVFNETEAYWCLPLRVKPFLTTEESVHPAYAATSLDDKSRRIPPCRTSQKGVPIKRKS